MTKEQEEAIKFLELHTNFMGKLDKGRCIRIPEENFTKTKQSIEIVLNMIKEKDAEIEKKDKIIDLMSEDWYKEEGYKNRLYEGESEITRYEIKKEILVEQYKKHYERKVENE